MNSVQIHLALTHVPVLLSLVGLVIMAVAMIRKNATLTHTAFILLLLAALSALPVYFTGEPTEELVEGLPGVSEASIEEHEELAKTSLLVVLVTGAVALAGLIWKTGLARILRVVVLVLALGSSGLMAVTAHLGGQIRHPELRSGFVAQAQGGENATDTKEVSETGAAQGKEDDD
jgi:uncharacterized membrane protein